MYLDSSVNVMGDPPVRRKAATERMPSECAGALTAVVSPASRWSFWGSGP